MNIRIDSVGYTEKPTEYVLINKRLAESRAIDLPWQKIFNLVGDKGYSLIAINKNYLNCFIPPELIKTKYTILSATANEKIYKMFFPYITIRCFNCKEARYIGKLIQDCTRSYSRRDIDSDDESVYKLIATHLGIPTDERMQFSEVKDECYKYWIHTYKNPDLREIQMYFIKSELIQAAERARLHIKWWCIKLFIQNRILFWRSSFYFFKKLYKV